MKRGLLLLLLLVLEAAIAYPGGRKIRSRSFRVIRGSWDIVRSWREAFVSRSAWKSKRRGLSQAPPHAKAQGRHGGERGAGQKHITRTSLIGSYIRARFHGVSGERKE